MSCSISIDSWESSMNLSNGVSISISFSLTLAIVVSISSISRVGRGSIGMGSIGSRDVGSDRGRYSIRGSNRGGVSMVGIGNSTITNGTISAHNTIAVVYTSDDSTAGKSRCNLADGVGITVSLDSSKGQKNKGEGSHHGCAEQSF